MQFLRNYEIIFQCFLLALAIYHIYRKNSKMIKSLILVFILSYLSTCFKAFFQISMDTFSNCVYLLFLFMALYLGSSCSFYDKYKWWDRLIHFLSGISFVGFGVSIASNQTMMKSLGILFFSFTFSVTVHVLWEVLEYLSDCFSHGNAQRWQKINPSINHVSDKAIQPAGLVDTMNDMICGMIGSLLAIIIWWLIL